MGYTDALQNVLKEIAIMKKLEHPNVIQLHEVIDYEFGDKLYMSKFKLFLTKRKFLQYWTMPHLEKL